MGISNSLQDAHWHVTIPAGIWKNMPSTRGLRVKSPLGHQEVEYGPPPSRQEEEMQISELEEWREKAYHSSKIYKERTKRWHDKRIKHKEFKLGDKVLMFNSRVKLFGHGKLRSKWEGPFKVIETSPHGATTLQSNDGNIFKVDGHHLKIFLELEKIEEIDTIEFLQFNDSI